MKRPQKRIVSPKANLILSPLPETDFYLNFGTGLKVDNLIRDTQRFSGTNVDEGHAGARRAGSGDPPPLSDTHDFIGIKAPDVELGNRRRRRKEYRFSCTQCVEACGRLDVERAHLKRARARAGSSAPRSP